MINKNDAYINLNKALKGYKIVNLNRLLYKYPIDTKDHYNSFGDKYSHYDESHLDVLDTIIRNNTNNLKDAKLLIYTTIQSEVIESKQYINKKNFYIENEKYANKLDSKWKNYYFENQNIIDMKMQEIILQKYNVKHTDDKYLSFYDIELKIYKQHIKRQLMKELISEELFYYLEDKNKKTKKETELYNKYEDEDYNKDISKDISIFLRNNSKILLNIKKNILNRDDRIILYRKYTGFNKQIKDNVLISKFKKNIPEVGQSYFILTPNKIAYSLNYVEINPYASQGSHISLLISILFDRYKTEGLELTNYILIGNSKCNWYFYENKTVYFAESLQYAYYVSKFFKDDKLIVNSNIKPISLKKLSDIQLSYWIKNKKTINI
jgi:hypothetical protein